MFNGEEWSNYPLHGQLKLTATCKSEHYMLIKLIPLRLPWQTRSFTINSLHPCEFRWKIIYPQRGGACWRPINWQPVADNVEKLAQNSGLWSINCNKPTCLEIDLWPVLHSCHSCYRVCQKEQGSVIMRQYENLSETLQKQGGWIWYFPPLIGPTHS